MFGFKRQVVAERPTRKTVIDHATPNRRGPYNRHTPHKSEKERLQSIVDYLVKVNEESVSMSSIASAIGVTQGHVSSLMKTLLERGTITRYGKPHASWYRVNRTRVRATNGKKPGRQPGSKNKPKAATVVAVKASVRPVMPAPSQRIDSEHMLLTYLKNHDGPVSQTTLARVCGVTQTRVNQIIKKLEEEKVLYRSLPTVEGTRYRVELPDMQPAQKVSKAPEPHNDNGKTFHSLVQSLIIEFMVATGKSDVASFSDWIDKRKK